jgi:hypothetical protein
MGTRSANSAQTVTAIAEGMTATGNSTDVTNCPIRVMSAQANVVGTGSVTATVNLQASLDGVYFTTIKTFSLSGTTSASDIALLDATFQIYRVNVSAISGTSATVSVYLKT